MLLPTSAHASRGSTKLVENLAALVFVIVSVAGVVWACLWWRGTVLPIRAELSRAQAELNTHQDLENLWLDIPLVPATMPRQIRAAGLIVTRIEGQTFRGTLEGVYDTQRRTLSAVADLIGGPIRGVTRAETTSFTPTRAVSLSVTGPGIPASATIRYQIPVDAPRQTEQERGLGQP